jgi:acyl carrier protein
MIAESSVKECIRRFVLQNLAEPRGMTSVSDHDYLIETGILDSLGILRLVAFLEETFSFRVSDDEIVPKNFQTIATVERLTLSKLKTRSTAP